MTTTPSPPKDVVLRLPVSLLTIDVGAIGGFSIGTLLGGLLSGLIGK
uniref:Uncharacterized protein n=1 Tax=Onchocerca volvulus TaxID=6282 RepID=A0A8R1TXY0_ONCVO